MADGQSLDWLQLYRQCVLRGRGQRPTQNRSKTVKVFFVFFFVVVVVFDGDLDVRAVLRTKQKKKKDLRHLHALLFCLRSAATVRFAHDCESVVALCYPLATLCLASLAFYFDDETMTLLAERAGEVKEMTRDSQFQMHHGVVPPGLLPGRDDMYRREKKKTPSTSLLSVSSFRKNSKVTLMRWFI